MAAAPQLDTATPAFTAGFNSGAKDAKEHRRRGHLLDDLPGLTAFASDSAFLATRGAHTGLRESEQDQYIAGYIAAYQATLKRPLAGSPSEPVEPEKPATIGRGRLQPMALRRSHRSARKPARSRR
ncbi:MAG TPA: hypothetical protein VFD32_12085 [Dehalococcoidia bacterium]|nr:hypothetical protein [Dehalococcoidia bacterium]